MNEQEINSIRKQLLQLMINSIVRINAEIKELDTITKELSKLNLSKSNRHK